jgi:hypothetical protein
MSSLPTAKQLVYQARYIATTDNVRIKHLTEAVHTLLQIIEDHEDTIRRIKSSIPVGSRPHHLAEEWRREGESEK